MSRQKYTVTSLMNELNNRFPHAYAIISTPTIANFQRREKITEQKKKKINDYCMRCDGDGCEDCNGHGGFQRTIHSFVSMNTLTLYVEM